MSGRSEASGECGWLEVWSVLLILRVQMRFLTSQILFENGVGGRVYALWGARQIRNWVRDVRSGKQDENSQCIKIK